MRSSDPSRRLELLRPRWQGQPGRLEVWYATLTTPGGTGVWLHNETVSPPHRRGSPRKGARPGTPGASEEPRAINEEAAATFTRGWIAVFENAKTPIVEHFGPAPAPASPELARLRIPTPDGSSVGESSFRGAAGTITWDLAYTDSSAPLLCFPDWAWRHELLPAAQVVPSPTATFSGTLTTSDREVHVDGARGAVAHIYGHGNAERWGWLHADLGDGDVLEVVSAVARSAGLRSLGPLTLLQLRTAGRDWPRDPLVAAPWFRGHLALPTWTVTGAIGSRRLSIEVTIPEERALTLGYTDPDGSPATCTNSELADADITLERRVSGTWKISQRWKLAASAHAEIGRR